VLTSNSSSPSRREDSGSTYTRRPILPSRLKTRKMTYTFEAPLCGCSCMLCICHRCLISDVDFGVLTARTDPVILRPAHIELLTKIFRRRLDFKIVSGSLEFPCLTLQVSFLYQQLRQLALTVNICNIGCLTPQPSFQISILIVNADFLSDRTFPVVFSKSNKT
jgi:hypothetical protein